MIAQPSESLALAYKNSHITYRELHENIVGFSGAFSLAPGERAIIFAENRPEWIYSLYGLWLHKAIVVPVDCFSSAADIAYIINDCRPALIFYSAQTAAVLEEALRTTDCMTLTLNFDEAAAPAALRAEFACEAREQATAVIIYTSGTTGSPKGVMLSHGNLQAVHNLYLDPAYFSPTDKTIAILPFHHIFPLQGAILIPLRVGAATVIVDQLNSEAILQALQKYRITIFIGVPRLYRMLLDGITAKIKKSPAAAVLFALSKTIGSYGPGKFCSKKCRRLLAALSGFWSAPARPSTGKF